MANFTTSTVIHAPREKVWAALADIGSIHVWNPGVKSSRTITEEDSGLGASRHCDLGGRNYLQEEVVEYDQGERLTMRVTESNLPFAHADIRFLLEPEETSTRVVVRPEYELKFGLIGTLLDRLFVRRSYEKGMQALLRGLKRHVESDVQAA
ncbi:MAG: SRPBCC family protein [Actinomycetota bacterium]